MKNAFLRTFLFLIIYSVFTLTGAQTSARKGWWKFDDKTSILKADIGTNLTVQGTLSTIDGPKANDFAVSIGTGSYLKMNHGITPASGNFVNEYTLSIDFRVSSIGKWYCFFQTSATNSNDGDCFINTTGNIGVGATGYSTYSVRPNEWYRLVVSVKNGTQYKYYLDGQLLLTGTTQTVDGRFSLDKTLLMFADEDGEDSEIDCSEISIWDSALGAADISIIGGYGHSLTSPTAKLHILVPYLQNPSSTSMFISWHDTSATVTKVDYGTTSSLGQSTNGTSELIAGTYRWHTVQLTGLQPNQEYFYKVVSGSGASPGYNFKTLPGANYTGKIRFLLFSDTHNSDTTMASKIIREAKKNMQQLYGNGIHNNINLVLHSGDLVVSGNNITQWTNQFFAPMSPISPNIPFLTVTGNHEGEHEFYYKYMKLDNISGYPPPNAFAERFWSTVVANTMFVGLNTNLSGAALTLQNLWLESKLTEAENDPKIDFVFLIGHHFSITELWGQGITEDTRPAYVTNQVFPILKKYSKVVQYSYGHTHGFERGTVESESTTPRHDFRMVCGGGGGGAIDRWGSYINNDYPSIHVTIDNFCYQLIEIDVANKTFESSMYSLGNTNKSRNNELMDRWYIKVNQPTAAAPTSNAPVSNESQIVFNTSKISGDSLMTVRIQVAEQNGFNKTAIDTMIHWKNIYKADAAYNPIDKNKGLDLTKLSLSKSSLKGGSTYYYRVKYRDHNLKWSDWSNVTSFNTPTYIAASTIPTKFNLEQNYPNPFNPLTEINYQLPSFSKVSLKVFDILGKEVTELVNQEQEAGSYRVKFDGSNLTSGVYFYQLRADSFVGTKKLVLIK
ncbi:MAG: fibronectin type III domain-containing protein [Ignavibacteria bacterium]|nr:fibronectin type III domain-containing protein [Ignavibacteria bacterium]